MFKSIFTVLIAFTMLFESLLPKNSGISESSKLGEFYKHYVLHQKTGTTFSDFLWMHYASNSKHKSQSEHQKLPSLENSFSFYFIGNSILNIQNESLRNIANLDFPFNFDYSNLYRFDYLDKLLNPPQTA